MLKSARSSSARRLASDSVAALSLFSISPASVTQRPANASARLRFARRGSKSFRVAREALGLHRFANEGEYGKPVLPLILTESERIIEPVPFCEGRVRVFHFAGGEKVTDFRARQTVVRVSYRAGDGFQLALGEMLGHCCAGHRG